MAGPAAAGKGKGKKGVEVSAPAPAPPAAAAGAGSAGALGGDVIVPRRVVLSRQAGVLAQLLLHVASRLLFAGEEDDSIEEGLGDLLMAAPVLCHTQLLVQTHWETDTAAAGAGKRSKSKAGTGAAAAAPVLPTPAPADKAKAMNVFVDVLLSLLSSSVRLTRDAVTSAFRPFAPECTSECVDVLMLAVMPRKQVRGAEAEAEAESDSDDDGSIPDVFDIEDRADSDSDDADSGSGSGSDSDSGGSDVDSDAGEEEVIEDAEMRRYDDALGKMLRERRSAKTDLRAAAVAAEHFRFRVLDLVDLAMTQVGPSPLLYTLAMPMLKCIAKESKAKNDPYASLRTRMALMLSRVGKLRPPTASPAPAAAFPSTAALALLSTALRACQRTDGVDVADAVVGVAWSLMRSLRVCGGVPLAPAHTRDAQEVGAMYAKMARAFLSEKSCGINPKVLLDFARRCPMAAVYMLEQLCSSVATSTLGYRVVHALECAEVVARLGPAWDALPPSLPPALLLALQHVMEHACADPASAEHLDLDAKKMRVVLSLLKYLFQKRPVCRDLVTSDLTAALSRVLAQASSPAVVAACRDCFKLCGVSPLPSTSTAPTAPAPAAAPAVPEYPSAAAVATVTPIVGEAGTPVKLKRKGETEDKKKKSASEPKKRQKPVTSQ